MSRNRKRPGKSGPVIELHEAKKPIIERARQVDIIPRNTRQEEYLDYLNDEDNRIVFATGPAGTGKTLLATTVAIREFMRGNAKKILLSRPAVSVDEDHGFLPGDINKKMDPWIRPLMDIFEEYYSPVTVKSMIDERVLEICPLAYLRGRTFKQSIIILDEAQLTTTSQLKAILTRIGEGSRMFVTGDLRQSDRKVKQNGLEDFMEKIKGRDFPGVKVTHFEHKHIERDPIVKTVLDIYGDED